MNKIIALILSICMSISLVGCSNNKVEENKVEENKVKVEENKVEENKNEIVINNQNQEKFKEYDILTYEILETNAKDGYLKMKIKITNNSDKPINTYSLSFNVYDSEGTKVEETSSYDETVLLGGKSSMYELYIEGLVADEIQLTDYYYELPNEGTKVFINKELSTVETEIIN